MATSTKQAAPTLYIRNLSDKTIAAIDRYKDRYDVPFNSRAVSAMVDAYFPDRLRIKDLEEIHAKYERLCMALYHRQQQDDLIQQILEEWRMSQ